jgi:hypothetical protein
MANTRHQVIKMALMRKATRAKRISDVTWR